MRSHLLWILLLAGCDDQPPLSDDPRVSAVTANAPETASAAPAPAPTTQRAVATSEPAPSTPSPAPETTPETEAPSVATASAAPSAVPSAAPIAVATPATLLGTIAPAKRVKLSDSRTGKEVEVDHAETIAALFEAVGMDQRLDQSCPSCVPDVRLVFSDAFGTRLGSIGWRCGEDPTIAVVHDALANTCKRVTIADVEAFEKIVAERLGAAP